MNAERLLTRFLQYVQIDTTANDAVSDYPSSPGQLELGQLVVQQLQEMGASNVSQDRHGIVMATIPAHDRPHAPVVAFNAHFDTSPETSGKQVRPQVIRNFDGQDLSLPGDRTQVITAATCAELPLAKGQTIVTSDGTTLLGGDDKAGVAIIMELANTLLESREILHGPVRLLFTCDEEIGRGVRHVDLERLAADVCYTFDGGGRDTVDHETFSADLATVTIRGVNIHPSIAKGKMCNAVRGLCELVMRLPRDLAPETTDKRQGFLHPYSIEGGVAQSQVRILLRDFDTAKLTEHAAVIHRAAREAEQAVAGIRIDVEIRKQYRNMAEGLAKDPRAVNLAVEAHKRLGREAQLSIVRGGTDGSQLTEKGLPCPNLSSGQHNIHSPLEWASLDEMVAACEVGIAIVQRWGEA
ncbi:MAG: peptidase T [Planctomycetota bacterium]|nr:peptidase T [Planctomycetota bacterium]